MSLNSNYIKIALFSTLSTIMHLASTGQKKSNLFSYEIDHWSKLMNPPYPLQTIILNDVLFSDDSSIALNENGQGLNVIAREQSTTFNIAEKRWL